MINVNGLSISSNNQRNGLGNGPLSINLKRYDYFPGEYVEGSIILHPTFPMVLNDIYLNVTISEAWNVRTDTAADAESSDKVVVTHCVGIAKILKINSTLINLNPGRYDFPFKFKLQENYPPVFEYQKNEQRGHLRYILKAQVYSAFCQADGNVYLFIKAPPRTLNSPLNFSATINSKKMGMIDNGTTILKTSFKQHYHPIRGKIPIDVEIDNSQGKTKVKSIHLKLVRRVRFKKIEEAKHRYNYETLIANYTNQIDVPPKTKSQIYHCEILAKDDTVQTFSYLTKNSNPYPHLTDHFYTMPSLNGYSIKCDYFIVASIEFAGLVSQNDANKVIMPILLYHLPKKENGSRIIDNEIHNHVNQNVNGESAPPNAIKNNNNNDLINSNTNVTINEVNVGEGLIHNKPQQNNNIIDNQNDVIIPQQSNKIIENEHNQKQVIIPQQSKNNQDDVIIPQQSTKIIENDYNQDDVIIPQQSTKIIENDNKQKQVINPKQNNNIIENEYNQNQSINP